MRNLVVHGEAEQGCEHDHWDERWDGKVGVDSDELSGPASLGDQCDDAVGGTDREQVQETGLQRDDRGAECREEQHERHDQHASVEQR